MYTVYWLINEERSRTYVGFSENLERRIKEHRSKKVRSTKNFGNFKAYKLENIETVKDARVREKYWKSKTGRKRLKKLFKMI